MKRVLVTGASGFVGSSLIPKLIESGHQVLSIVRSESSATSMDQKTYQECTLADLQKVIDFNPHVVINLATFSSSLDDAESQKKIIDSNISFLSNLLLVVKELNVELFVNTGTFAEYFSNDDVFDPAYFYSATKTAGRFIVKYFSKAYSFKSVDIVPYSIYGPNDKRKKLIHALLDSLDSMQPVKTTQGRQVLDFVYIDDVANAFLALIDRVSELEDGMVFKIGTGNGTTIRDLVKEIEILTGKKANIIWGAIPYRKRDIMVAIADTSNARCYLNWQPKVSLREGLTQMLKYDGVIN
jgi:nucleoside-diphosphate-sugar epimerase